MFKVYRRKEDLWLSNRLTSEDDVFSWILIMALSLQMCHMDAILVIKFDVCVDV